MHNFRKSLSKTCTLAKLTLFINIYALRRFASDTAHIVFIHITYVVKPLPIFMARNRVSLLAEFQYYDIIIIIKIIIIIIKIIIIIIKIIVTKSFSTQYHTFPWSFKRTVNYN